MATLIVMYTLRRRGGLLLGPINRWIYASFAPKEHAFQIARREANKRGFTPASGRRPRLQSASPAPLPVVLTPPDVGDQADRIAVPALAEAA